MREPWGASKNYAPNSVPAKIHPTSLRAFCVCGFVIGIVLAHAFSRERSVVGGNPAALLFVDFF